MAQRLDSAAFTSLVISVSPYLNTAQFSGIRFLILSSHSLKNRKEQCLSDMLGHLHHFSGRSLSLNVTFFASTPHSNLQSMDRSNAPSSLSKLYNLVIISTSYWLMCGPVDLRGDFATDLFAFVINNLLPWLKDCIDPRVNVSNELKCRNHWCHRAESGARSQKSHVCFSPTNLPTKALFTYH